MQTVRFIKASSVAGGIGITITLADGTKSMAVENYQVLPEAEVQVVARPRAASVDVFYRDNQRYIIRFRVRRQFTSMAAANTFMHRHAVEVSGRGELQYTVGGGFGSQAVARNCVLQVRDYEVEGIALHILYEAIAPSIGTAGH